MSREPSLTARRWSEIAPILDRALDLPHAERRSFLRSASRGSPELERRLNRLVSAADDDTFLDTASRWRTIGALQDSAADASQRVRYEGLRVGPYRILEEIGRGGMGLVFLAERADGLWERTVALKLIRSEVPSHGIIERFVHERRVLARLDHPDIVRLLDGGATDEGWPYFAMELVAGQPITDYCDGHRLDIRDRLELFLAACQGVQHAHDRHVIHRDLKPSNIHVTADRQVKLLDFGVARILQPRAADEAGGEDPDPSLVPMTPEYAAPELFRDGAADPSTDVYSLAVVLYELLAGRRPHPVNRKSAERFRPPRTRHPVRLGKALTRFVGNGWGGEGTLSLAEISAARRTDIRHLRRRLRGDLELILGKALAEDRSARYPSVDAFATDIRAHLAGRPISAHPEGRLYRLRKFAYRRGAALTAGALVVLSVGLGVLATAWQSRRASTEARRAAETSELLVQLLNGMQVDAGPEESQGLRETLEAAATRFTSSLAEAGPEQAEMIAAFGVAYLRLGEREQGLELLHRGLDLRNDRRAGPGDPVTAALEARLGEALLDAGDLTDAEALFNSALRTRLRNAGPPAEVSRVLAGLGAVALRRGNGDAALAFYRRALTVADESGGVERADLLPILRGLSRAVSGIGRPWEAVPLQREVLLIHLAEAPGNLESVQALVELSAAYLRGGDVPAADWLLGRVLVHEGREPLGDLDAIAEARREMAATLLEVGAWEDAVALLVPVLAHERRTLGLDAGRTLATGRMLAEAYLGTGLVDRAASTAQAVVAALETTAEPPGPKERAASLALLGETLIATGRAREGEVELRSAIDLLEAEPEPGSELADALLAYGRTLARTERCQEAEPLLRRGLENRPTHGRPRLVGAQLDLAECLIEDGAESSLAGELLGDAYEELRARPGRSADKLRALSALVRVHALDGNQELLERYRAHLDALRAGATPRGS